MHVKIRKFWQEGELNGSEALISPFKMDADICKRSCKKRLRICQLKSYFRRIAKKSTVS